MRRFTSGTTDQYIYFVAVDSTDYVTRETGLSSFTVYRARNGAAAAAYTTPTIAEVSSANMPGVYSLLLDEDMTIGSGNKSEEVVLHITQASMAPVTLIYELYRPDVTDAETITVSSGAVSTVTTTTTATNVTTVNGLAAGVITATSIAADAIGASELAADAVTEIAAGVWDRLTSSLTTVGSAGKLIVDNLNATVSSRASQTSVDTVDDFLDTEIAAIKAKTDNLPADPADASDIAVRFTTLDTAIADLPTNAELATALGTADDAVLAQVALVKAKTDLIPASPASVGDIPAADITAIKAKTDNLPTDPADASDIAAAFGTVNSTLSTIAGYIDTEITALQTSVDDIPTNAELATALGTADDAVLTQIALVKAKTDSLTFTVAGQVDANIQYVNDVQVNGTGAPGSEWGP